MKHVMARKREKLVASAVSSLLHGKSESELRYFFTQVDDPIKKDWERNVLIDLSYPKTKRLM